MRPRMTVRGGRAVPPGADSPESVSPAQFGGASEGRDAGNVLGARAVVRARDARRRQIGARAGSLCERRARPRPWERRVVAAHAVEVDAQRFHVDGNLAERLNAIDVHAGRRPRGRWRAISAIGCMVPSSLLACMMETSTVSGRRARRTSSGLTTPSVTGTRRESLRRLRAPVARGPSTAGVSMAVVIDVGVGRPARAPYRGWRDCPLRCRRS